MFRGHHHNHGGRYDSQYQSRGGNEERDKTIEIIQQFRDFKPYLKKRLDDIHKAGRTGELEEEVDDIKFYLEVMNDVLKDGSQGVEQLQTFIDRIHEMIRKNPPILESKTSRRRSVDFNDEEFGDEDRPRSPSPEARGSSSAANIPLIPTHGAHRTVEVDYSPSSHGESSMPADDDAYDDYGRRKSDLNYTRRESFKDVDMRNNYYVGGGGGRSERRWNEEVDFRGARGVGRGMGLGRGMGREVPMPHDAFRPKFDPRTGRGRPVNDSEFMHHRQDLHQERGRSQEINHNGEWDVGQPDWRKDNHSNGNMANDWQSNDHDRRQREWEEERRRSHSELSSGERAAQKIAKHFERRPSSETRRENDDLITKYDRREREAREAARSEATSFPPFVRGGRDDERNIRSRIEGGPSPTYPSMINPPLNHNMNYSRPPPIHTPFASAHRVPYPNAGLLPTPPFQGGNPLQPPNPMAGGIGLPLQNPHPPRISGGIQPRGYPPPLLGHLRPNIVPTHYRKPPPPMPNIMLPPPSPHHTPDQYQPYPNYPAPVEPSPEELRDITLNKARECFKRNTNRISGSGSHAMPSSTVTSVSPGPASPTATLNDHQGSSQTGLDPRLNRGKPSGPAHSQQQSPPPPQKSSTSTRIDAGNTLRPSADPRARIRIEEEKRRIQERERPRHQESLKHSNKPSKLQELRKQFEKETMFRLGRRPPKKQSGSFEDAISSCDATTSDASTANKTTEKNKEAATSKSKEKEGEDGRQQRSHSDKTEREKSPKKGDEKTKSRSTSADKDKKNDKRTNSKSQKKGDKSRKESKKSSKKASETSSDKASSSEKNATGVSTVKLATFKIPRKPKPIQSETPAETGSKSSDKNVSTTPPDSPEPALSQVPDSDNRSSDETEPSTSAKSKASSSTINADGVEFLKQFLMTSAEPAERESILSNPATLNSILSKLMTEINAVKGKSSEDGTARPNSAESDKSQSPDDDVQQRGRSRERGTTKRTTKRRSSLEKLHDALKEMRFDRMLPLGPRRCTRGEPAAENAEVPETAPIETESVEETTVASPTDEGQVEEEAEKQPKKRGRRPAAKVTQKVTKVTKAVKKKGAAARKNISQPGPSTTSTPPPPIVAKGKGKKRKLKAVKLAPKKRVKKSGPVTRAQAALKKSHKDLTKKPPPVTVLPGGELQNTTQDTAARKKKTTNMILRRYNRSKKITALDTVVNRQIDKIKLESDYVPPSNLKPDPEVESQQIPEDKDYFASFGADLPDDLTQMIDDQLNDEAFANLDRQTDDNEDLTIFMNSLYTDEQVNQVVVTHEVDLNDSEGAPSELSYERIINGSSSTPTTSLSKFAGKRKSSITAGTSATATVTTDTTADAAAAIKDTAPLSASDVGTKTTQQEPRTTDPITNESLGAAAVRAVVSDIAKQLQSSVSTGTLNAACSKESDDESVASTDQRSAAPTPKSFPTAASPSIPTSDAKKLQNQNESLFSDSVSTISSSSSCSDSQFSLSPQKSAISEDMKLRLETVTTPVKIEAQEMDESRKFKCQICSFSGKKIVHHYVNKHYPCDIPQARLEKATFDGLLEMNSSGSPQLLEITLDDSHALIWPCLYCENRFNCIAEFYDHLTSHTGEFRFECGDCPTSYPHQKSLVNHVKQHKGVSKNCLRTVKPGIEKDSKELSGFLCNDCFYFQLRFENIMRHIEGLGHNQLEVKSVRLIRPSGPGTADATLENKLNGEKSTEVPPPSATTTGSIVKREVADEQQDSSGNLIDDADVYVKTDLQNITRDNQEVFFGTDIDFAPPSVTLNECTLVVPNVFEHRFLDSLLKKVSSSELGKSEQVMEVDPFQSDSTPGSRKRKRSDSNVEDDNVDDSSEQSSAIDSEMTSYLKENLEGEKPSGQSSRPRVCILKKMRLRAKKENLELNPEEPNDFFASSDDDDSSETTSGSEDSDDESPMQGNFGKLGLSVQIKTEPVGAEVLRNNEHLIKTRPFETTPELENYMEKRNLTLVRRPGDQHAPNTVLFGYIRPSSSTGSTKLRDSKELDKLGGAHGRRPLPMKEVRYLAKQLTRENLLHIFKCMGTHCCYTTDNAAEFQTHLNCDHLPFPYIIESCARFIEYEDSGVMKDADCCAYCSARYKQSKDLIQHIINQHGQSTYQCNKCFYRGFYQRYVVKHFEAEHPNQTLHIMKCARKVQPLTEEATLFQIFVYKCNIDNPTCDKTRRFVFREDYLEHLQNCAPKQDVYPCHLCQTTVTFEELIEHYKVHNLFKFHCSYCQFGSEVKTDLDEHFVNVHPNTSGRVFYRVKPTGTNQAEFSKVPPLKLTGSKVVEEHTERPKSEDTKSDAENSSVTSERETPPSTDISGIEDEDGEKGRVTNLKGRDLYRCVTGNCSFTADDSESFKEHVTSCSLVADSRSLACGHCERKLKTVTNLLEHMKVHGEKKQVCSICSFRCWTSTEITKHIKAVHKVMSYKLIKQDATEADTDPDIIAFPKDVFIKSLCDLEAFENNYYSFTKKAVYSFENIDKLPPSKIFSADLFCAMCPYSTKVRTNIVRHLSIHKQALEDGKTVVPQAPRINPVPYLSREGLEFDKMMNLAASSHKANGGTVNADDVRKLPQFVKDQFRYVCSVCDHITSDESLLQTHIKVIHREVTSYKCPHCQKHQESRDNPEYTVSLDKISHHLRLHGPKLLKCGHCMVVHHHLRAMEKHIPEKHPEKKPIHYVIRDVDPEGVPSNRPTTSGNRRQSVDDPKSLSTEKWKCYLCSSKSVFGSWEEAKSHCETVHKANSQFMCLVCNFSSDDVTDMLTHCRENCKSEEKNKILVMFSKCEDGEDVSANAPVWKRYGGAVRHIHGNFTEDSVSLIKQYNNQQNNDSAFVTSSPTRGGATVSVSSKNQVKPTTSTATKARRSVGGSVSPKPGTPIKNLTNVPSPLTLPKVEVFKFRCHKCDMYKTKNPSDLRVHLFNEFGYKRWKCLTCSTTFTTEKSLKGHIERDHQKVYQNDLFELQPAVPEIEAEIDECIEKQNRKRDLINSFAIEKLGKLTCKYCKDEEGLTYETFETHILQKHSS